MRAERLRDVTPDWHWDWIDTDAAMRRSSRVWRSLAFRFKWGKSVERINADVSSAISPVGYDLIWVDKGVFLTRATMSHLRNAAKKMVHFTPDTAFHANVSRHFEESLGAYDLLVTTKAFEIENYRIRGAGEKTLLTTQGYDAALHRLPGPLEKRRREAVFVGLAEPDREECLGLLLRAGIPVRLGGRGWERFLRRHAGCSHLFFEGQEVFGHAYVDLLSRAWVGLGLLSKRFPELHTTRTFEIPACGGILATERTADTERFFDQNEVLFFYDYSALAAKLKTLFFREADEVLAGLSNAGHARVLRDRRDYASILCEVLNDARLKLPTL